MYTSGATKFQLDAITEVDIIHEFFADAGVTIDNCLIKDGKVADSNKLGGKSLGVGVDNVAFYDSNIRVVDSVKVGGYSPQGIRDMNTVLKCTSIVWSASIVAGAPTPDYYMEFSEPSGVYKYRVPCYRFTIP